MCVQKMNLAFRLFSLALFATLARGATFTDVAAFSTACAAHEAGAQLSLITSLESVYQACCAADQSYTYTTTFGGESQVLTSTCAPGTPFNEALCYARVSHVFQIAQTCVSGDTLFVSSAFTPGYSLVC